MAPLAEHRVATESHPLPAQAAVRVHLLNQRRSGLIDVLREMVDLQDTHLIGDFVLLVDEVDDVRGLDEIVLRRHLPHESRPIPCHEVVTCRRIHDRAIRKPSLSTPGSARHGVRDAPPLH